MSDTTIPRGQRLEMAYAGAEWVQGHLEASAKHARKGKAPRTDMSPLGITVADVLGFVYRGIYHIERSVRRVEWSHPHCIEVGVGHLATIDGNELTILVTVCHDLGLRLEIEPHGPRMLKLRFWQRTARTGQLYQRCPSIDDHIAQIRAAYRVLPPDEPPEGEA